MLGSRLPNVYVLVDEGRTCVIGIVPPVSVIVYDANEGTDVQSYLMELGLNTVGLTTIVGAVGGIGASLNTAMS